MKLTKININDDEMTMEIDDELVKFEPDGIHRRIVGGWYIYKCNMPELFDMLNDKRKEVKFKPTIKLDELKIPSLKLTWWYWILHPLSAFNIHRLVRECKEIEEDIENISKMTTT